jgi:hypothetical protein
MPNKRERESGVLCYINPDWKEMGHVWVAVARQNGKRGSAAIFLVDLYCLGVKDVMGGFRSIEEFKRFLPGIYFDGRPKIIAFDLARSIVWGAVEYAHSLGFEPHLDFQEEKYLLGAEIISQEKITFGGPEGKPLYVVGPNDPADDIVRHLERRVGRNGFKVVYPDDFLDAG